MEDPETHLTELGVELGGSVDANTSAVLDAEHREVVNGQLYWTSSAENLELFRAAPHRYTGPLRDPVSNEWFQPTDASPMRETNGGIALFASLESARAFDASSGDQ